MTPNPVYDDPLTRASEERLRALVTKLPEPVALAGGHAVRYRVMRRWRKQYGYDYFGSRDIDVAYQVEPSWSEDELRRSALGQAPAALGRIGYRRSGMYRFEALIDAQGKPLSAPARLAMINHDYFILYVDLLATAQHRQAKQILGFNPVVEPLLAITFQGPAQRTVLPDLGPDVLLPSTSLLVATKLRSLQRRAESGDKATKDLCDLFALIQYGGDNPTGLAKAVRRHLPEAGRLSSAASNHPHLSKAAEHLEVAARDLVAALGALAVER